ncbi:hypothetical protein [Alkaliphilus crotonatoxidans]
MKKIVLVIVILILTMSLQVTAISEIHNIDSPKNCSHIEPMIIEHHTCGYGGDSCRMCYTESKTGWCGCTMYWYKCCCGTTIATREYYCSQHP